MHCISRNENILFNLAFQFNRSSNQSKSYPLDVLIVMVSHHFLTTKEWMMAEVEVMANESKCELYTAGCKITIDFLHHPVLITNTVF